MIELDTWTQESQAEWRKSWPVITAAGALFGFFEQYAVRDQESGQLRPNTDSPLTPDVAGAYLGHFALIRDTGFDYEASLDVTVTEFASFHDALRAIADTASPANR